MADKLPSTFCVIPWIHRHTDETGYHKLCCIAEGPENQLTGRDGKRLHVSQKLSDEQVLNSPKVKHARKLMLRGEWPAACIRCQQSEESSGESSRLHLNARFDNGSYEALVAHTAPDGTAEAPVVRYADIRLGNVCNLTCRMCAPLASKPWVPNFNSVQPRGYRIPAKQLKIYGEENWVKSESVHWLLDQSISHVEAMHFAGGEPLILPETVEALQQCITQGRASEIELSFNTNMTVLPEKVTALWPHFKSVSLLASIDGFGRTTEYIRRGSRWADIDRNLHKVDENFHAWKIKWATVSCTTQISNVLNLDQLFAYVREAGFANVTPVPQLIPLYFPDYLSVQALPQAAKDVARKRLELEIERSSALRFDGLEGPIDSILATLAFMDAADTTRELDDFLSFTEKSDALFGDSWREATPELAEYIDAYMAQRPTGISGLLHRLHVLNG